MKRNLIADAVVHIATADGKIAETIKMLDALATLGRFEDVGLFAAKLVTLVEARQVLVDDLRRIWRRLETVSKLRKARPSPHAPSRAARRKRGS